MAIKRIRRKPPKQYYTRSQIRKWIPLFDKGTTLHDIPVPPLKSDLTFDWWDRESGTLVLDERVSGDDAAVVGGKVANITAGTYYTFPEVTMLSTDTWRLEIYIVSTTNTNIANAFIGDNSNSNDLLAISTTQVRFRNTAGLLYTFNKSFLSGQYIFEYDGTNILITYPDLNTVGSAAVGSITFKDFGQGYITNSWEGVLGCFTLYKNGVKVNQFFNNGHAINSVDGAEATNNGVTFAPVTDYTPQSTQDALDLGYWQNKDWLRCTASGNTNLEIGDYLAEYVFTISQKSLSCSIRYNSDSITEFTFGRSINEIRIIDNNPIGFKFKSASDYLDNISDYRIKLIIDIDKSLYIYCDKLDGNGFELVPAATGSNPTAIIFSEDISNIDFDFLTDDRFKVHVDSEFISMDSFVDSTGTYTIDQGEQVINKALNTTGLSNTTGWTEHEGGAMHNLVNSYVCLNPTGSTDSKYDILDRINQTAASTDSVYYDSTDRITRSTYHISELDYDVLQTFFEPSDQNKVFVGFNTNYGDKLENFEVFVYENQKTGDDLIKVLNYINYNYLPDGAEAVVKDGEQVYLNGSLVYKL